MDLIFYFFFFKLNVSFYILLNRIKLSGFLFYCSLKHKMFQIIVLSRNRKEKRKSYIFICMYMAVIYIQFVRQHEYH